MESIQDLLSDKKDFVKDLKNRHKYVTKEFQDYGYRLALKLGDLPNVSMYIKLAKVRERALLESAYSFVADYPNAKSKSRLFLWKLKQLQDERNEQLAKNKKDVEDSQGQLF
jgi:hypothetical protein